MRYQIDISKWDNKINKYINKIVAICNSWEQVVYEIKQLKLEYCDDSVSIINIEE